MNHVVHANRAVVHLKLDKLDAAEDDCTRALALDRTYVKAWSRRGMTRFRKGRYGDAADDFEEGLALQSDSKEIQSLLANAIKKYNEVEGREYVSKKDLKKHVQAKSAARITQLLYDCTPAVSLEELEQFLGVQASESGAVILAESGFVAQQEQFTRVSIVEDDDDEDDEEDEHQPHQAPTKIAIVEDDEEDEEVGDGHEAAAAQSPTRIAIAEDDDEEDEEEEIAQETFTKVAIEEETDSEDEEDSAASSPVNIAALLQQANALKERGNELLKAKQLPESIAKYSEALDVLTPVSQKQPNNDVTEAIVAITNNRAMAYLSAKQYHNAITDCTTVLSHPQHANNCKALYRRAVCFKETNQLLNARVDVERLLVLEPGNATGIALKKDVDAALATALPTPAPAAAKTVPKNEPKTESKVKQAPTSSQVDASSAELDSGSGVCDEWSIEQQRQAILALLNKGATPAAFDGSLTLVNSVSSPTNKDTISVKSLVSVYTLHVTVCLLSERWQDAITAADRILAVDANNVRALVKRADARDRLGDSASLQLARADLLSALRVDSSNTEAMGLLDSIEHKLSSTSSAPAPAPAVVMPPAPPTQKQEQKKEQKSEPKQEPKQEQKPQPQAQTQPPAATPADNIQRAVTLKEQGNDAIKAGNFTQAVQLYTQSLALDASSAATHNNRAQAYLKLSLYVDAEKDATAAMNICTQLTPAGNVASNVLYHKALYRRANARKSMGGASIADAVADYERLCELDPTPANKKELEHARMLLKERAAALSKSKPVSAPASLSSSSSSLSSPSVAMNSGDTAAAIGLSAVKTTMKKRVVESAESVVPESATTSLSVSPTTTIDTLPDTQSTEAQSADTTPTKKSTSAKNTPTKTKSVSSMRQAEIPSEPPKTLYELERIWRSMKDRPDLFAQYLAIFKKSTFKKVAKESLSSELLTCLFVALRDHAASNVILTVLDGLTQTSGFGMMVHLLPAGDTLCLQSIFAKLLIDGEVSSSSGKLEEVNSLKKKYGLA
jgi:tetratricopeptide (TPR) repeat protein